MGGVLWIAAIGVGAVVIVRLYMARRDARERRQIARDLLSEAAESAVSAVVADHNDDSGGGDGGDDD